MKRNRSKEGLSSLATADAIDKSVPLLEYVQSRLENAARVAGGPPTPVVIGAKGKVGSGAVAFAEKLGLKVVKLSRNDLKNNLIQYEILVNAIKLDGPVEPFLKLESLHHPGALSCFVPHGFRS